MPSWDDGDTSAPSPRYVWKRSPDSEDIRQHLLTLLNSLSDHLDKDYYPSGARLGSGDRLATRRVQRAAGGERVSNGSASTTVGAWAVVRGKPWRRSGQASEVSDGECNSAVVRLPRPTPTRKSSVAVGLPPLPQTVMNTPHSQTNRLSVTQLEQYLWSAADILRRVHRQQ